MELPQGWILGLQLCTIGINNLEEGAVCKVGADTKIRDRACSVSASEYRQMECVGKWSLTWGSVRPFTSVRKIKSNHHQKADII